MTWTPHDIAALICDDPTIEVEDILHNYLREETTIRLDALKEHFSKCGMDITDRELLRLMDLQENILFTEFQDDRGRFWRASIVPDQHSQATEGYLDHRTTDQYDDALGQDFSDSDVDGGELAGVNAPPQPGEHSSLDAEIPANPEAFATPPELPAAAPNDQSEMPPAATPRSMPDLVAQAMEQMPSMDAMEPGLPEPGMQPGSDEIDMAAPPAQPGPGEERPAPQTGPVQPQQPQLQQPQSQFGTDGADYTIDPLLNALGDMLSPEETTLPQTPQTSNMATTGARTQQDMNYTPPGRYSQRMREAWEKRSEIKESDKKSQTNS